MNKKEVLEKGAVALVVFYTLMICELPPPVVKKIIGESFPGAAKRAANKKINSQPFF